MTMQEKLELLQRKRAESEQGGGAERIQPAGRGVEIADVAGRVVVGAHRVAEGDVEREGHDDPN